MTERGAKMRERSLFPLPLSENLLTTRGKDRNVTEPKLSHLVRCSTHLELLFDKPKKMEDDLGVKVKFRIMIGPQRKSPHKETAALARAAAQNSKFDSVLPLKQTVNRERWPSASMIEKKERTSFLLMYWWWETVFILRSRASTLRSTLASTGVRQGCSKIVVNPKEFEVLTNEPAFTGLHGGSKKQYSWRDAENLWRRRKISFRWDGTHKRNQTGEWLEEQYPETGSRKTIKCDRPQEPRQHWQERLVWWNRSKQTWAPPKVHSCCRIEWAMRCRTGRATCWMTTTT